MFVRSVGLFAALRCSVNLHARAFLTASQKAAKIKKIVKVYPTTSRLPPPVKAPIQLYPDVTSQVRTLDGEIVRNITLDGRVFNVPIRQDIVHKVVVWQLAKRRQGTHKVKHRGEVRGSTRKIAPQKGQGAARHGNIRAPQFRGGGRVHGPTPRSHATVLQRKVRILGLKVALSAKYLEGKLYIISDDSLRLATDKTRDLLPRLLKSEMTNTLLVAGQEVDENLKRAASNLSKYVSVVPTRHCNVYAILRRRSLALSETSLNYLQTWLLSWPKF
eukprot:TRINITY_DN6708_c0_g1_i1.p1 TRINITY_DN6708_c0_g1~~TRINITY_DN6708_c0_g1_i1.p1  ORF type:complete len:274 (-),score=44.40 TRINITY_DN6708_c0_g1_i1:789-1610(-)